ncbi:group III truncated hemoglobin [Daejeonella lutea]|uniref:Hemoglobin n=1 Tax=Daejeonella lutea TaxID=572036 RepID=A0A1T5A4J3_9SPHI|nr:group III truncated hemoglobin [Daejeonella lutea]SKB29904.1 hemoglobin [Daejeonella lutea]
MKNDIRNRSDIELFVEVFYAELTKDKQLAYIFKQLAHVNFSYHLPVMYNFWENIMLCKGTYEGNPMALHKHLHEMGPLNEIHFRHWDKIFARTLDTLFAGPNTILAKKRGLAISAVLRKKVIQSEKLSGRKNPLSGID